MAPESRPIGRRPGSFGWKATPKPSPVPRSRNRLRLPRNAVLLAQVGSTSGSAPKKAATTTSSTGKRLGYKGAVLIEKRPDLFYKTEESPTFKKLWKIGTSLKVKIAPDDAMANDAGRYDPRYNVILISVKDFQNKDVKDRDVLRRSTVHELFHAYQNASILKKSAIPEERTKLITAAIKKLGTEEAYIEHILKKEAFAEKVAWRCHYEALVYFSRRTHKHPLSIDDVGPIIQERVENFLNQTQKSYVKGAKKNWKKAQSH